LTGVIRGSFLGGATPVISSPDGKLFQVTGVAESSSDTALHFTIALNDNLPRQTSKLSFQVSKKSDGSTITSPIYDYTIQSPPKADSATGSGAGGTASIAKPQNAPTGTPPGTPQAAPSKPKELNSNDP
jgi:hypothetical protein